jgi:hypothetical protein
MRWHGVNALTEENKMLYIEYRQVITAIQDKKLVRLYTEPNHNPSIFFRTIGEHWYWGQRDAARRWAK